MTLVLTRNKRQMDGVFSTLTDEHGAVLAKTLEHAYGDNFEPKLQPGSYGCKRGAHRLHGMTSDFETFEVEGVKGHKGILFHVGNYNADSDGCILLGEKVQNASVHANTTLMITNSKAAFASFMSKVAGSDSFVLIVR